MNLPLRTTGNSSSRKYQTAQICWVCFYYRLMCNVGFLWIDKKWLRFFLTTWINIWIDIAGPVLLIPPQLGIRVQCTEMITIIRNNKSGKCSITQRSLFKIILYWSVHAAAVRTGSVWCKHLFIQFQKINCQASLNTFTDNNINYKTICVDNLY